MQRNNWNFTRLIEEESSEGWYGKGEGDKYGRMESQKYYTNQGKAVPLQAWSGPERSRKLRFPDLMTTTQEVGKFFSLKHWPHLPPGNSPGTHFC